MSDPQNYNRKVAQTVNRMQRDNDLEHRPLTERKIRSVLRHNLAVAHPGKTVPELNMIVDEILPRAMQKYRGPNAIVHAPMTVDQQRAAERKRVKNAMRSRRRG